MSSDKIKDKELKNSHRSYLLLVTCCLLLSQAACGTKTPPTLKAYEKPPAPTELSAVHKEGKLLLTWSYPESLKPSIRGFQVLRSEGQGFDRIAFLVSDKNSFEDIGFKLTNSYKYNVVAKNLKEVLSRDSNIITVTPQPLPQPPADIRFRIRPDSLELAWSSSGPGVCYNIYKAAEKGGYGAIPLNREPVCGVSFNDDKLFPDKTVYYAVSALLNTPIKDEGYASAELEVNPNHFIPSQPTDIRAVRTDKGIYLTWEKSPEQWISGYDIYRKISGEPEFKKLGKVRIPVFVDHEPGNKKVWYAIRAVGFSRESDSALLEVK